ncbi:MAG: nitroreductase family protein [Clostridia bacterium]|jgi:nitroreductase|nr:nitroreductase family protein [Clostridia bacterium]
MDFYDVIKSRHSIRDFADESIPDDIMKRIVEAAYTAPANDHFRDWHYVVLRDKDIMKNAIAGVPKNLTVKDVDAMTFISDPIQKETYQIAVPKQYKMLIDAAAVIIPLMKKKVDILNPSCLSDLNCYASVWCSIENVWLAATSEGYGCNVRIPMGNEEAVAKETLDIPDEYLIPCFIGIGRPAKGAKPARQIEVDYNKQIHWEHF